MTAVLPPNSPVEGLVAPPNNPPVAGVVVAAAPPNKPPPAGAEAGFAPPNRPPAAVDGVVELPPNKEGVVGTADAALLKRFLGVLSEVPAAAGVPNANLGGSEAVAPAPNRPPAAGADDVVLPVAPLDVPNVNDIVARGHECVEMLLAYGSDNGRVF